MGKQFDDEDEDELEFREGVGRAPPMEIGELPGHEQFNEAYDVAHGIHERAGPIDYSTLTIAWEPQPGSQVDFLSCPVFEVLYEGTRGPGKTDALLMDFFQHVNKGYGAEWKGILFRRTYPELEDVINKSQKWFPLMDPGSRYNKSDHTWTFSDGATLRFRHMAHPREYWKYHGHAYPWIAFEEITTWPDPKCYLVMMSCSRSTQQGMPRKYRSTTNPYGVGHNWVKKRFRLSGGGLHPPGRGQVIRDSKLDDGSFEPERCAIHGHISENRILLDADPGYIQKIVTAAENPMMAQAWLDGSWDIVAGGMFDDVRTKENVLPALDLKRIPRHWKIDRSFDWGGASPFSVGWYAHSAGEDVFALDGTRIHTLKGDVIRIAEWYGAREKSDGTWEGIRLVSTDISKGIVEREMAMGIWERTQAGAADSSIFNDEDGDSIGDSMELEVQIDGVWYPGVSWNRADKSKGSRVTGWQTVRKLMKQAHKPADGLPRETPGFFVTANNPQFLRTVPVLPRDDKNLDDVNTAAEDHIGDEVRYQLNNPSAQVRFGHNPV